VTIACFGLAFKPDIDDLRESPALQIAQSIAKMHVGRTYGVEPNIHELPEHILNIELTSFQQAIREADIHLMLVDHKEFKCMSVNSRFIIDTKGIWKS
jgi:UDP-N-acetyl-D-mannosaminuronic acid dehydrogenase